MATVSVSHIRWMIRADLPSVLNIEAQAFTDPWERMDFLTTLANREVLGMVAEVGPVVGYMIWEKRPGYLQLLKLAVSPRFQRHRFGSAMLGKLKHKLLENGGHRKQIIVEVPDVDLYAHLFLKANGFRAVKVIEDVYEFRFGLGYYS